MLKVFGAVTTGIGIFLEQAFEEKRGFDYFFSPGSIFNVSSPWCREAQLKIEIFLVSAACQTLKRCESDGKTLSCNVVGTYVLGLYISSIH